LITPRALQLRFTLHEAVMAKLGAVTLRAAVNGRRLEPETFRSAGEHVYKAWLPPDVVTGAPAHVEFQLDKALPADLRDGLELGVIVVFERTSVARVDRLLPIRFV
jgi:hypothetical protein